MEFNWPEKTKIDHLNERFVIKPSTLQLAKEAQEKDEVETKDEEIKQLKAKMQNFVKNKYYTKLVWLTIILVITHKIHYLENY